MKKLSLKRITGLALSLVMLMGIAACGGDNSGKGSSGSGVIGGADGTTSIVVGDGSQAANDSYKIAIVQQLDHASLDEIRRAVEAELDRIAQEQNITITYKSFSGNNDPTLLSQIGAQVIGEGYDAIIPIATLAAQQMTVAAEETQTPVIYAAISDPAEAELTDISYVTGTSDALNTEFILDMMMNQNPDIETVGLLYSTSEANSRAPIAQAIAYLEANHIKYVEKTGNTTDEVISAVSSIRDQVDAIFTPTDNVVMAAELAIADTLIEAGIPHYTGADSFVRNGAFATAGVNYTELGTYTAKMTVEILQTGVVPAYHVMDGGIITVNTETAEGLQADYSIFHDMASQVVEVVTTED